MKLLKKIVVALVVLGGLNWGLKGFLDMDLVAKIAGGEDETLAKAIYGLIGIAALLMLFMGVKGGCCSGDSCGIDDKD